MQMAYLTSCLIICIHVYPPPPHNNLILEKSLQYKDVDKDVVETITASDISSIHANLALFMITPNIK